MFRVSLIMSRSVLDMIFNSSLHRTLSISINLLHNSVLWTRLVRFCTVESCNSLDIRCLSFSCVSNNLRRNISSLISESLSFIFCSNSAIASFNSSNFAMQDTYSFFLVSNCSCKRFCWSSKCWICSLPFGLTSLGLNDS